MRFCQLGFTRACSPVSQKSIKMFQILGTLFLLSNMFQYAHQPSGRLIAFDIADTNKNSACACTRSEIFSNVERDFHLRLAHICVPLVRSEDFTSRLPPSKPPASSCLWPMSSSTFIQCTTLTLSQKARLPLVSAAISLTLRELGFNRPANSPQFRYVDGRL